MDAALVSCLMVALIGADRGTALRANPNFLVCASSSELANELLVAADAHRDEMAEQWLGEKLPLGVGRTHIHLELSDTKDNGWTWPIDHPDRKAHMMWLVTDRDKALGSTLAHEITHIVLLTRYPGQLPAWANEGAACQQDDKQSIATRRKILRSFAKTGRWPKLSPLLAAEKIPSNDQSAYATAVSLTEFFLARGDKPAFIRFAVDGKRHGWNQALTRHYRIRDVVVLETAWKSWATRAATVGPLATVESRRPSPGWNR